jgi:hypothetical protein
MREWLKIQFSMLDYVRWMALDGRYTSKVRIPGTVTANPVGFKASSSVS